MGFHNRRNLRGGENTTQKLPINSGNQGGERRAWRIAGGE
jgi:hypothetical protein